MASNFSSNLSDHQLSNTTAAHISLEGIIIISFTSLSFLGCLAVLVTYSLFKELRTLPGKILINLVATLLVASLFTLVSIFVIDVRPLCKLIAIILHYTYLAEFFWMSVLSFEIACEIRRVSPSSSRRERVLLSVYSLFGWGLPVPVTAIAVIVNFTRTNSVRYGGPDSCPDGGTVCPARYCFITEIAGYIFALYVPVGASLLFNISAAGFIVYTLTKATVNRYKLHMTPSISYIRVVASVVCITGVAYIGSAVFLSINAVYGYRWAIDIFAALGTMQGFLVSLVFLLKRRTFRLYKLWCASLSRKLKFVVESRDSNKDSKDSKDSNTLARNGNHPDTKLSNGKLLNGT